MTIAIALLVILYVDKKAASANEQRICHRENQYSRSRLYFLNYQYSIFLLWKLVWI